MGRRYWFFHPRAGWLAVLYWNPGALGLGLQVSLRPDYQIKLELGPWWGYVFKGRAKD